MPNELLETAVKLASAGMSGVCIFMALWSGYVIYKLPDNASKEKHRTVRQFMWICVLLSTIALTSGVANAYFSREKIVVAQQEKRQAETQTALALEQVTTAQASLANTKQSFTRVSELIAQGNYQQAHQVVDKAQKAIVLTPPDELFKKVQVRP